MCRELVTIRALHYQLGVGLGLPPGEMDALKTGSGASQQVIDQAFSDVILKWLRQRYDVTRFGLPTWKRLVEAVKDPVGANNPALAVEIAAKHPSKLSMSKVHNNCTIGLYAYIHMNYIIVGFSMYCTAYLYMDVLCTEIEIVGLLTFQYMHYVIGLQSL